MSWVHPKKYVKAVLNAWVFKTAQMKLAVYFFSWLKIMFKEILNLRVFIKEQWKLLPWPGSSVG